MVKKFLAGWALALITGTAFAQTISESSKPLISPQQFPPLQYKADSSKLTYRSYDLLKKKRSKLLRKAPQTATRPKEDVTTFYSNMLMARVGGKKQESAMPMSKPDSAMHYHLLKKQYKVVPLPEEAAQSSERK